MKTTLGKLFHIKYGQKEYENKSLLDGDYGLNIIISSKGEDNGVYGFYDIKNKYSAPIITVPRTGTIGQAFLQLNDCSVDNNCLVLIPKDKMSIEQLYQICFQIRLTKWKYKYGRQITPLRLSEQEVTLNNSILNFEKMVETLTPLDKKRASLSGIKQLKTFKIEELFKVSRGKGKYLEKLDSGNTPVISTQDSDCGICGFYDVNPTFKQKSITIGRIMCNPNVQLVPFSIVPADIFVLNPLNSLDNKDFLFYVSAIIKAEKWRFNYYRKLNRKKLEKTKITLPLKNGEIDYEYISKLVHNSYGYDELNV